MVDHWWTIECAFVFRIVQLCRVVGGVDSLQKEFAQASIHDAGKEGLAEIDMDSSGRLQSA